MENTKCNQELSQLLFPVFCHLYLDAISDGNSQQVQTAVIFFKRHQSLFTCESLRDIIKDIGSIFQKEEIENKPLVKAFRFVFNIFGIFSYTAVLLNCLNSLLLCLVTV